MSTYDTLVKGVCTKVLRIEMHASPRGSIRVQAHRVRDGSLYFKREFRGSNYPRTRAEAAFNGMRRITRIDSYD